MQTENKKSPGKTRIPGVPVYLYFSFNRIYALTERRPIVHIAKCLHSKRAGPHNQPFGRIERREQGSAPAGLKDRLVLAACRTDFSTDAQRSIRNQLRRGAPKRHAALMPLFLSGNFRKLQERADIAQAILVHSIVRGGNRSDSKRIIFDFSQRRIRRVFCRIMHHPRTDIPSHILRAVHVFLLMRHIIQCERSAKQRRRRFFVDANTCPAHRLS